MLLDCFYNSCGNSRSRWSLLFLHFYRYANYRNALGFVLCLSLCHAEIALAVAESKLVLLKAAPKNTLSRSEMLRLSTEAVIKADDDGYKVHQGVDNQFDHLAYERGENHTGRKKFLFRLRSPAVLQPGKKYPLIIWFHGAGKRGNDNFRQLAHIHYMLELLVQKNSQDFFMLATQCPNGVDWSEPMEGGEDSAMSVTNEILETLLEELPIDASRVSLVGLSTGGSAIQDFYRLAPSRFSGLLISSATLSINSTETVKTPIWVFNCTDDPQVSPRTSQSHVDKINQNGGRAALTLVKSAEHNTWKAALSDYKAVIWLIDQQQGAAYSPPPGTKYPPRALWNLAANFFLPVFLIGLIITLRAVRVSLTQTELQKDKP